MNIIVRTALRPHKTDVVDEPWDGPAMKARLLNDEAALRSAFAWIDPDGDPTAKSGYKFIHHMVSEDGVVGAANITACRSGIAILNGARGGADIPDTDRPGVWRHLAGHLTDADLEPPPLRSGATDASEIERRVHQRPVEFRDGEPSSGGSLTGYAAVTGVEAVIEWFFPFREVIEPGAFHEAIARDDVRSLFNHDPNVVLGRTTNQTLRLNEDEVGLRYEVDLNPDDPDAQRVRAKVKRGDVTQSSFAFRVEDDEWDETEVKDGKLPIRRIRKVQLFDVSPVTYPAYPQTSVSARAAAYAAGDSWAVTAHTRIDLKRAVLQRDLLRRRLQIEEASV